MPFYEYQCDACGHELEALQKISDPPLTDCPNCGQPALKKRVSAAAFRLKGGGWYETDFKSGNKKNLHEGGEKKDSPTEKKEGGEKKETGAAKKTEAPKKTEAAPAAKTPD